MTFHDINFTGMKLQMVNFGIVLGSRRLGAEVREEIEKTLNHGDTVIIDLEGVSTVSNSFADECFAKLLMVMEFNDLKKRTSFVNAVPFVQSTIKVAIKERLAKMALA